MSNVEACESNTFHCSKKSEEWYICDFLYGPLLFIGAIHGECNSLITVPSSALIHQALCFSLSSIL
jgi:hypothetical protein